VLLVAFVALALLATVQTHPARAAPAVIVLNVDSKADDVDDNTSALRGRSVCERRHDADQQHVQRE